MSMISLLDALRRDAIALAALFKPSAPLRGLILVYDGEQIPLEVPPAALLAPQLLPATIEPADFEPTPLQIRMIQFLVEGPKSPTQMKNHTKGRMYDSPGGVSDLIEVGIVEKKFAKYRLTPEIGVHMAEEIGTEEPE